MKKRANYILLLLSILTMSSYAVAAACIDLDSDTYGIGCTAEDCNDNDPLVNQGVDERCLNGIDDNCNGEVDELPCRYCADYDGDGYGDRCGPGNDCDDTNPNVNPGTEEKTFELCTDGTDNDCDGLIDQDDLGTEGHAGCSAFYTPGEGGALAGAAGGALGAGGAFLCEMSNPLWIDADGNSITEAAPGQDITLIVFGEDCVGEEAAFEMHKIGGMGAIEEETALFEAFEEGEGAMYTTEAPAEEGRYFFKASTKAETLTSEVLLVGEITEGGCEVQWDCSAIEYGPCIVGVKTREICPGYEGTAQCCSDEASCACPPIIPESTCDTYTYATVDAERSCITKSTPKITDEEEGPGEEEVAEAEFPWMLAIGIAAGVIALAGLIIFLVMRKPAVQVPASLINYVKTAKEKKTPNATIKQALEKSGWKPEQIKAAFKKAK